MRIASLDIGNMKSLARSDGLVPNSSYSQRMSEFVTAASFASLAAVFVEMPARKVLPA